MFRQAINSSYIVRKIECDYHTFNSYTGFGIHQDPSLVFLQLLLHCLPVQSSECVQRGGVHWLHSLNLHRHLKAQNIVPVFSYLSEVMYDTLEAGNRSSILGGPHHLDNEGAKIVYRYQWKGLSAGW